MTTSQLNRRLAADLDKAFPALVTEMQTDVYNGALRWTRGRQDAEDVTQEVFVRAYRALQGYSSDRINDLKVRPWLFTITLNLCRNHARSKSRRPRQVDFDGTEHADPSATDDAALDRVATDEWRERLSQLSARQRDAIVLRHVVGFSYAEIEDVLDRPMGTIKSDVSRGLDRLRSLLVTEVVQ